MLLTAKYSSFPLNETSRVLDGGELGVDNSLILLIYFSRYVMSSLLTDSCNTPLTMSCPFSSTPPPLGANSKKALLRLYIAFFQPSSKPPPSINSPSESLNDITPVPCTFIVGLTVFTPICSHSMYAPFTSSKPSFATTIASTVPVFGI